MSNLNDKFKQILEDLETNIQSKEELEYIKTQIFNLYNLFFEEINRIEEVSTSKIETIAATQVSMQAKIENLENKFKAMEEELFVDDDECDFSITCPYCNNEFVLETEELKEEIECPECNNIIELDWGDECGCGCDDCHDEDCGHDCSSCHCDEEDDM